VLRFHSITFRSRMKTFSERENMETENKSGKMVSLDTTLKVLVSKHVTIANFPEIFEKLNLEQREKIELSIKKHSDNHKWIDGRANFPLNILIKGRMTYSQLSYLLKEARFSAKGVSSDFRIKLPLEINSDLAYFLGVQAGDGYISKPKSYHRGGWAVQMCEDDFEYQTQIYKPLVERLFGCSPKLYTNKRKDGRKNLYSSINSMLAVLYLTKVLGIKNGFKADIVDIPEFILKDKRLALAFIGGLFDTDGTVTNGEVKVSTVSKNLIFQVKTMLDKVNIKNSLHTWLKNENVRTLYTISISRKSLNKFNKLVGFRNIKKDIKLKQIIAP